MDFDDVVLRQQLEGTQTWLAKFHESSEGICALAGQYRGRDDCIFRSWHCGSFNLCVRLHWEDGQSDWLIRFPIPGKSMFPEEKLRNEVAVMQFVQQSTNIPVPTVIAYASGADNPTGLGPFIIMTFVEGRKMSEIMKAKTTADDGEDMLDPSMEDSTLKTLYGQLADILLELFQHDFDRIGALSFNSENNSWSVEERPLTLNMNETVRCSGLSDECFQSSIYSSAADYFLHLAQVHFLHLLQQRNGVFDAADCREKYTCRHLFQAIVPHFICKEDNSGPYKLYCDDFSPSNILVDDHLHVVAVIDWEFCYAAPVQFSTSPPWWLLLRKPTDWLAAEGPQSFLDSYVAKLEVFLQVMQQREEARANLPTEQPLRRLSARMQNSMDDNSFWFNMAARTSFGVDDVYWYMLDEHCYGQRKSIRERVSKATSGVSIYSDREEFVVRKIKQLQEYNAEVGCQDLVGYEEHEESSTLNDDVESAKVHNPTVHNLLVWMLLIFPPLVGLILIEILGASVTEPFWSLC
jgi:Phosphotransferase enzyme family